MTTVEVKWLPGPWSDLADVQAEVLRDGERIFVGPRCEAYIHAFGYMQGLYKEASKEIARLEVESSNSKLF